MRKSKILSTLFAAAALSVSISAAANAQPFPGNPVQPGAMPGAPVETIRTPLLDGAPSSAPFVPPPEGQPPAMGDGPTPAGVHPGQAGMPLTLLPWVPSIPANQIDNSTSGIPLPINPAVQSPPGVLGPALTPFIPAPPSTPGPDPGSMQAPMGYINPADEININPAGGLPGTGGYYTSIPTVRRGGQESHQYEYRGRNSIIGGGGTDGSQDNIERLGPWAGWGAVTGVPSGNGWRNSAIDLGGGQRFQAGGTTIPTGSTVQDYGLSSTRQNGILGLTAQQTTEFGQGMRRLPQYSSKSTDFGFPYAQFDPANTNPQKRDQLLLPTAIITNF
ncbi:hypothetical protein KF728_15880 [Candidatus Obscuribacterales bacterium]|nr:hypothetical protein [Candidatus Obscuribacterales bacterium]MBX3151634.1 hypothetical protein [Candidatus Obscuribacterales bacterium]